MSKSFSLLILTVIFTIFLNCSGGNYDLIITGGTIIDGTGQPAIKTDIGITGDRIIAIGNISNASAVTNLDASGKIIAPGFIDVHTHADRGLLRLPANENYIMQGVTTVVGGNCGGSPLDLDDYFSKVIEKNPSTNIAVLFGHNTVRREVMQMENRAPTDEELEKMKDFVDRAMRAGAVGLSTGLGYLPGVFSKTEEIIELNKVVAKYDGIYASHIRDQGDGMYDSVLETIRIGEEAGTRVQVSHLKLSFDKIWGEIEKLDKIFTDALDRGVEVYSDQYPYIGASTSLTAVFPLWSLDNGELLERLKDPDLRKKIKKDFFESGRMKTYRGRDMLQAIQIASYSKDKSFEGKNLRQILEERGVDPTKENGAELAIEIAETGGASCVFFLMDESDIPAIMSYPYNMIGSDGSVIQFGRGVPHPRSYGTFPRVLGKYVREDKTIPMVDAIHKMTGLPAKSFRLEGRGRIEKGFYADIVVFDPETVIDKADFANPHQYPVGISYVIVNGVLTIDPNGLTDSFGGRPIYGPGKTDGK